MDTTLREQFDRAVSADPGADPAGIAHAAIAAGGRIRRRRAQLAVTGVAAGLVAVLGVTVGYTRTSPEPEVTIAAAMMPVAAPSCSADPVERDATDVQVFLAAEATGQQREAVREAVGDDARVGAMIFETREEAYERFKVLWADSPDFVAAVSPKQLPESFRMRLSEPGRYAALRREYVAMPGVSQVLGRVCAESAPIGGTL